MVELDDFIIEINKGFESIRTAMSAGFKDAAANTSELNRQLGILNERMENVRAAQKDLEDNVESKVGAMKDIEKDVDKNTAFRKKSERVAWVVAKVVIAIATTAGIILIARAIISG